MTTILGRCISFLAVAGMMVVGAAASADAVHKTYSLSQTGSGLHTPIATAFDPLTGAGTKPTWTPGVYAGARSVPDHAQSTYGGARRYIRDVHVVPRSLDRGPDHRAHGDDERQVGGL